MTTDMVRVELGGEVREVARGEWRTAADELVARHGGVPNVTPIGGVDPSAETDVPPAPGDAAAALTGAMTELSRVAADGMRNLGETLGNLAGELGITISARPTGGGMNTGPLEVEAGRYDMIGHARSTLDKEALELEGFAVAPPIYDRGTRVNETGVENARAARQEWEAMPLVTDNCRDHSAQIAAEDRQDSVALVTSSRMQLDGTLLVHHVDDAPGEEQPYVMTEDAFASLVTRMKIPAAGRYLRQCWPELRATNVNGWIGRLDSAEAKAAAAAELAKRAAEYAPLDMRLRHRLLSRPQAGVEAREIFGVVGPGYADFDADKLDEAIALAVPAAARGRITYDGKRTRWEILFHSTVQPKHFVAGEFFRAGVIVGTDDTGGGAVHGHAVAWQNLCLNLIIIQTTTTAHFEIRHVGEIEALAKKFRAGFAKALGAIDHFVRVWDYAVEDNVVRRVRQVEAANGRELPASENEVMAGIFRDAIERELVPVRGIKTEPAVLGLMRAWQDDESAAAGPTRAAVANAFTRWAHTGVDLDPWREDEIQRGAGALLRPTKKDGGWATALGFLSPEDVDAE